MSTQSNIDRILKLLSKNNNVLLLGPPATGKSRIMTLVAEKFLGSNSPGLAPGETVPIPNASGAFESWMPSDNRIENRKIYPITFHQGTKHRDFVSGIMPNLAEGETGFKVQTGILVEANLNAINNEGASLILIDEINRGPAVTIFGDTLSAMERDKRLNEEDDIVSSSLPFYALDAQTGKYEKRYLSKHVYILATMNEADTSVEPMDVAFLRRFMPFRLNPDSEAVGDFFQLNQITTIPDSPSQPLEVIKVLSNAWEKINEKISLGRGDAYMIGHGIIMEKKDFNNVEEALEFAVDCWYKIENHVREVFFGNEIAQSIILNSENNEFYSLEEVEFGDQPISKLKISKWDKDNIYKLLKQVSTNAS